MTVVQGQGRLEGQGNASATMSGGTGTTVIAVAARLGGIGSFKATLTPADPEILLLNRRVTDFKEAIHTHHNDDIAIELDSGSLVGRVSPGRGPAEKILGPMVISRTQISSPVAQIILTLPPGYSSFDIKLHRIVPNADGGIYFQFSTDNGVSYVATGYYQGQFIQISTSPAATSYPNINFAYLATSQYGNNLFMANLTISPEGSFPAQTKWLVFAGGMYTDGNELQYLFNGRNVTSGARWTHIKFFLDGGVSFVGGIITLIGTK